MTTGAWCYYNNDSGNNATHGKLYNWYAVNDPRGLAPAGYHIPTITEFSFVTDLKSPCGFTGLASGERYNSGTFLNIGYGGFWWSSTSVDTANANSRYLVYPSNIVGNWVRDKTFGSSVRCIRD